MKHSLQVEYKEMDDPTTQSTEDQPRASSSVPSIGAPALEHKEKDKADKEKKDREDEKKKKPTPEPDVEDESENDDPTGA